MCPNKEILSAFFDGEISNSASKKIEAHVDHCPKCREQIKQWERISSLLQPVRTEMDQEKVNQSWSLLLQRIKEKDEGTQKRAAVKPVPFYQWLAIGGTHNFF